MDAVKEISCRVCGKKSQKAFEKALYWGALIPYYCCESCGHLQSSPPSWLPQAYQAIYGQEDVGMASRCLWTAHTAVAFAWKAGIGPTECCLDWGTGTGLFVRFSRDAGLNCYGYEPLANSVFADPFICQAEELERPWRLITAFEVVEHFVDPAAEFSRIFRLCPDNILFSTLLYQGQGPDWWYLVPNGQHIALYTENALQHLGQLYGYHFISDGNELHLFSKKQYTPWFLRRVRKNREVWTKKFRKLHGSYLEKDAEVIRYQLMKRPGLPL